MGQALGKRGRRRRRSYSFTDKDKDKPEMSGTATLPANQTLSTAVNGEKKGKKNRSVSSAAKFSLFKERKKVVRNYYYYYYFLYIILSLCFGKILSRIDLLPIYLY